MVIKILGVVFVLYGLVALALVMAGANEHDNS